MTGDVREPPVGRKLLFISGFKIFPAQTGGHLHTGGVARALARLGYSVRLYSFAGRVEHYRSGKPPFLLEDLEPGLVEETHLGWGIGLTQAFFRRMNFTRRWQFEYMRRGVIPARLEQALTEADVILSDLPYCPVIPGPWASKPWYLVSHNLEYELLEQGSKRERAAAGWMKSLEEQAPANYRDIFACAESDQAFFRAHDASGSLKVPIIRVGVDPEQYEVSAETRAQIRSELGVSADERLIIFSGSRFGPNLEALEKLKAYCAAHMSWLEQKRIRILVAGSMEKQPGRAGVMITTGRVTDMIPYFAAADAGLNPVERGSGANVKLFEYLAARLPVISTRFGVRGSLLEPARDYVDYDPANPGAAFEAFVMHDRAHWQRHAENVWQRHRGSCDIQELVRVALSEIPDFGI